MASQARATPSPPTRMSLIRMPLPCSPNVTGGGPVVSSACQNESRTIVILRRASHTAANHLCLIAPRSTPKSAAPRVPPHLCHIPAHALCDAACRCLDSALRLGQGRLRRRVVAHPTARAGARAVSGAQTRLPRLLQAPRGVSAAVSAGAHLPERRRPRFWTPCRPGVRDQPAVTGRHLLKQQERW